MPHVRDVCLEQVTISFPGNAAGTYATVLLKVCQAISMSTTSVSGSHHPGHVNISINWFPSVFRDLGISGLDYFKGHLWKSSM